MIETLPSKCETWGSITRIEREKKKTNNKQTGEKRGGGREKKYMSFEKYDSYFNVKISEFYFLVLWNKPRALCMLSIRSTTKPPHLQENT